MVDQSLLTIFIALTAVAVLIQAGILVGFCFLSMKLSRQADNAIKATNNILGPIQRTVENLQTVTAGIADFTSTTQGKLRRFENWWRRSA